MIFVNDLDLPLLKSISLSNALQGYDSESNSVTTPPNNRITLVMKSEIDHSVIKRPPFTDILPSHERLHRVRHLCNSREYCFTT